MNGFKAYKDVLIKALDSSRINEELSNFNGVKMFSASDFLSDTPLLDLSDRLLQVANEMGCVPVYNQKIGHHPHFLNVKQSNTTENHYILSAFIDIRKSTRLYNIHDNETIMMITNTIQLAAIRACITFGGFIQRIHGDGLFVYFGGKGIDKRLATNHCATALSFFTYFVKNDLKELFSENGIEQIYTTIGIDFGDDREVLWALAGINDISEIATYSLHTNLASKMQAYAKSNEIIIGDNVINKEPILSTFSKAVEEKRYIHENPQKNFRYTQYKFDWYQFLRSKRYLVSSPNGEIEFKPRKSLGQIGLRKEPSESLIKTASNNRPWCQ